MNGDRVDGGAGNRNSWSALLIAGRIYDRSRMTSGRHRGEMLIQVGRRAESPLMLWGQPSCRKVTTVTGGDAQNEVGERPRAHRRVWKTPHGYKTFKNAYP